MTVATTPSTATLSKVQQDWIKQIGAVLGDASVAGASSGASSAASKKDLFGLPSVPDIIGSRTCNVLVINNTSATLLLDEGSLDENNKDSSGEYKTKPPKRINPQQKDAHFKAVNKSIPIIGTHTAGVDRKVRYFLDDQKKTSWTIHFDNPAVKTSGNSADVKLEGANKDQFEAPDPDFDADSDDATFTFLLNPKGGPPPGPTPPGPNPPGPTPPGPQPGPDLQSSCLITVNNNTKVPLALVDQGKDKDGGDFMSLPPTSIQPGATASFVFVETPNSKDNGCRGFLVWEVGSPMAAIWRVEWNNPEGQANTTTTSLEPQTAGFRSLDQIGQGEENVPVVFTISGGGQAPAPPGPSPAPVPPGPGPVPPGPNPPGPTPPGPPSDFTPPTESKQPTLRKGDESSDGWVEYLQSLLIKQLGDGVGQEINGKFDAKTEANVKKFQQDHKPKPLQVDGVVGNQTWAALRKAPDEAVGTDGRQPHTFKEQGPQARWVCEQSNFDLQFDAPADELRLVAVNVGVGKIDDFEARVRVTPQNGKATLLPPIKIGPPTTKRDTGSGDIHKVVVKSFLKTFGPGTHQIEGFLPQELGGDNFKDNITVPSVT